MKKTIPIVIIVLLLCGAIAVGVAVKRSSDERERQKRLELYRNEVKLVEDYLHTEYGVDCTVTDVDVNSPDFGIAGGMSFYTFYCRNDDRTVYRVKYTAHNFAADIDPSRLEIPWVTPSPSADPQAS